MTPIGSNPFAHLMKSERFSPQDRLECREMTVKDEKTGDEVLMLKRGFGEMAVWKPAEEWRAEDKAMWQKFYKEHPVQPEKVVGTYEGDWDGCGDPPGTNYVEMLPDSNPKRGRIQGWNAEPVDVPLKFWEAVLQTLLVVVFLGMALAGLFAAIIGV